MSVSKVFAKLLAISEALERAGVPPISRYWRREVKQFYAHPTAKLLVEMVGRGGDKSRTSVMMAIAEVLAGDFRIPPGERHYFTHVSEIRDEATKTLSVLEQYLKILGIPFDRTGDTIELRNLPRGFKVLACRIGAVSGWRCIGWTADECAKWNNDGVDPSAEVIASIKAMTVTHPSARGRMFSSPLATLGYFYETGHEGNNDSQLVGHAPSWVANPSITEEQTYLLERDPRRHAREYGAIPSDGTDESLFDPALIDRAMREEDGDIAPQLWTGIRYRASMDQSLGQNGFTLCIGAPRIVANRIKASIVCAREWRAPKGRHLDLAAVLGNVASAVLPYGVKTVWCDQYQAEALDTICDRLQLGIRLQISKPTLPERLARYESALTRFLDDEIDLPPDPQVRADLISVQRRIVADSADRYTIHLPRTPDGRHCDFAPSVVGVLEQIPSYVERTRHGHIAPKKDDFLGEERNYSIAADFASVDHMAGRGLSGLLAHHIRGMVR